MRAGQGQGIRGICYGEEGATSKTKDVMLRPQGPLDPVGTCPQLANTAAKTFSRQETTEIPADFR